MTHALTEFSKEIDPKLVEPLRQSLKGRKLVYVTDPQGFEIASVEWGKIIDMSDGMVSYSFTSGNTDQVDAELDNAKVPVYWKAFEIDRRIYESWRKFGVDIDATNAIAAAQAAARVENTVIIDGLKNDDSNYDIKGIYQSAGCDFDTSTDLSTYGKASDAIAGALNLMDDQGVPVDDLRWNWAVNSTSYRSIMKSRNANDLREINDIRDLLNDGDVMSVGKVLTTAQGVILPDPTVGEPYVDFYLTADWQTDPKTPEYQKTGNIGGRVFSAGRLRVKQAYAICKTSALA